VKFVGLLYGFYDCLAYMDLMKKGDLIGEWLGQRFLEHLVNHFLPTPEDKKNSHFSTTIKMVIRGETGNHKVPSSSVSFTLTGEHRTFKKLQRMKSTHGFLCRLGRHIVTFSDCVRK
jgi:hypothetical protein